MMPRSLRGKQSWLTGGSIASASASGTRSQEQKQQPCPYSISALLTRNLQDVFGDNDPARRRVAIDEIFTEDCVFYDPSGASTGAETRSIESRARSRLRTLTSISANRRARRSGQWRAGPIRPPCSETAPVHDRTEPTVLPNARARGDSMADTYRDEVIIKVRANLDCTMVTRLFTDNPIAS
jgi:hypothetical protein